MGRPHCRRPSRTPEQAQQRERRHTQQADRLRQRQDTDERHHAQHLGGGHEAPARHAIGEHARRDGQEQERQRLRGLEQPGRAGAGAESEHGDERRRREADLLGRLRRQIGPGQPVEGGRKTRSPLPGHGR
jgi:hypothetical protein